ncbi:MAG: hypothetical protein EZS28_043842, partial [Streblomastix strix]
MQNPDLKQEEQPPLEQISNLGRNQQEQAVPDIQKDVSSLAPQPIRPLGHGSYGLVYLVYDREYGVVANKIIQKQKYNSREWDAAENI